MRRSILPTLIFGLALATIGGCSSTRNSSSPSLVEIRGTIRDRDGFGVEGVNVFLDPTNDKYQNGFSAITDRNGNYRLRVRSGRYQWALLANEVRVPTVFMDTILLTAPVEHLSYRYEGVRVEGRIIGPNGVALDGTVLAMGLDARRFFISPQAEVRDGRYRLFLPPSTYTFHSKPRPDRYPGIECWTEVRVSADTTIDFSADGHLVTGRVALRGAAELRDARITASHELAESVIWASDKSSADGGFSLYLPDGEYSIYVSPGPNDKNIARQWFHCRVDGPQTLTLELGETIWRGTVRDSTTRSPSRYVNVVATDTDRRHGGTLVSKTDGLGRFMLAPERGRRYAMLVGRARPFVGQAGANGILAGSDSTFDLLVGNSRDLAKDDR